MTAIAFTSHFSRRWSHSTPEKHVAAILRRALAVLEVVKEPSWRFMFMRTVGFVSWAKRKVDEK
jgi:hypothetical protein